MDTAFLYTFYIHITTERETMVLTRTHLLCDKESKTLVREKTR